MSIDGFEIRRLCAVAGCVALVFVGCSSSSPPAPPSDAVSASVGPSGGTVRIHGLAIEVPAGALSTPATIGVTVDPAGPPGSYTALSPLFRFTPDGLTFARPATVTFVAAANVPAGRVFWSTSGGGYDALPTTWHGTTASAEVSHFSGGFVGLPPPSDGGGTADAAPPPGNVGDSCVTLGPSGPVMLPCASNLMCYGGICVNQGIGGYCDDSSECYPYAGGCGGPFENFCIVANHTCGCACNCSGPCTECAARVGGSGAPCGTSVGLDPRTGMYYVDCQLSLTCVNGTCQ
jgi:hypothetical protein